MRLFFVAVLLACVEGCSVEIFARQNVSSNVSVSSNCTSAVTLSPNPSDCSFASSAPASWAGASCLDGVVFIALVGPSVNTTLLLCQDDPGNGSLLPLCVVHVIPEEGGPPPPDSSSGGGTVVVTVASLVGCSLVLGAGIAMYCRRSRARLHNPRWHGYKQTLPVLGHAALAVGVLSRSNLQVILSRDLRMKLRKSNRERKTAAAAFSTALAGHTGAEAAPLQEVVRLNGISAPAHTPQSSVWTPPLPSTQEISTHPWRSAVAGEHPPQVSPAVRGDVLGCTRPPSLGLPGTGMGVPGSSGRFLVVGDSGRWTTIPAVSPLSCSLEGHLASSCRSFLPPRDLNSRSSEDSEEGEGETPLQGGMHRSCAPNLTSPTFPSTAESPAPPYAGQQSLNSSEKLMSQSRVYWNKAEFNLVSPGTPGSQGPSPSVPTTLASLLQPTGPSPPNTAPLPPSTPSYTSSVTLS
eukprot:RCo008287